MPHTHFSRPSGRTGVDAQAASEYDGRSKVAIEQQHDAMVTERVAVNSLAFAPGNEYWIEIASRCLYLIGVSVPGSVDARSESSSGRRL